MDVRPLDPFPEVLLIEPDVYRDERGFFIETWQRDRYEEAGIEATFVQDNHSRSKQGVLRGLHFQSPHPQGKLIRATRGAVYDVVVDLRIASPTFSRWAGCRISDEKHRQLWVPEGFAHGFAALTESADVHYRCTAFYEPESERTLQWNDPQVGVDWPVQEPTLSDRDAAGRTLDELRNGGHLFDGS